MLSRRHLIATGAAMPLALHPAWAGTDIIKLRDLYNKDRSFSDLATSLAGQRITVAGFMAPPLKADAAFFVLTKMPMSTCPFCETEAEWPDDILAVYIKRRARVVPYTIGTETSGVLELGPKRDEDTGFLSRVRLSDATYS